jgi:3-dehydrotetronate 4-kinase
VRAEGRLRGEGIALVDAIEDTDLVRIAHGCVDLPLITGGSGISRALPGAWRERLGWMPSPPPRQARRLRASKALLLAGSCSDATLRQIETWRQAGRPLRRLDAEPAELADWCEGAWQGSEGALIYSSAPAAERTASPESVEAAFAKLASMLRGRYARLIVAGGETSGAVVDALGVKAVRIGDAIDPGVPALQAVGDTPLHLALKSGNFGAPEFFEKALHALE